jgi:hypothetical protein
LHVADVIEDQELEGVKALQGARQRQIAFCREQLLDEAERGREQDGAAPLYERVAEGGCRVRLAAPR